MHNESYANDRFATLQQITCQVVGANAAANDELARFRFFQRAKVLEVRAIIGRETGAADTSGLKILNGTSSIGAVVIGTNTEGTVVDASLTDTEFASTEDLVIQNIKETDTFTANVQILYQQLFE